MFRGFANVWTIVGLARDLRRAPLPVEVAGERVVLFRDAAGHAHALVDRCPHRGVKLSLGRVVDGCIECPFHGWQFAGDGTNCHVPWNPDARPERLGATPLPLRERGQLLWLYTAPGTQAPEEPMVPDLLLDPRISVTAYVVDWQTHWTRAMENMLDWPHLPFIHRKTIGHNLPLKPGARMDLRWVDHPWGGRTSITIDGEAMPGTLDYRFPNAMELSIPIPKRVLGLFSVCLPLDERRTRMILVTARDFLRARVFDRVFHMSNRRVAGEDQAVLESSDPREVPSPGEERSVRTDEPTLKFRKIYRERLQDSDTAPRSLPVVA